jgi:hypothetical protein
VGTALGTAAGKALQMVASLFGVSPATVTPESLTAAIAADPQAALKLKMAEMDHQRDMANIALEEEKQEHEETKAYLADVQNARQREMDITKTTGHKDLNLYVLAWTIIGGFLFLTAFLLYFSYLGKSIVDQTGVLYMLLGTLSTSFGMVVGYFFGSSKGSADKSMVMDATAKTLAVATADTAKVLAAKK